MLTDDQPFIGHRFLVIEDEALVAMLLVDMIEEMGGTIAAIAHRVESAATAIREIEVDCATVDVNLAGELSFPLAALLEKAQIPFAFCTAIQTPSCFQRALSRQGS